MIADVNHAARGRSSRPAHEKSLTEILSLSDWWRFVPETLALLGLIWLAGLWLNGDGGLNGSGNMPHPFWVPVLLVSCQYGIMGGVFATLAATALFFLSGLPVQSATQDFYEYGGIVAVQPCAWLATTLVLGGLRTLHIHHHSQLKDRFDQVSLVAEDLAAGLEQAIEEIARLEQRIVTDCRTVTVLLHSLATLDTRDRRSLMGSIVDLVRFGVGANSFSIHLKGAHGLEPCFGVADGAIVSASAVPSLPDTLLADFDRQWVREPLPAEARDVARTPVWAPIRQVGTVESFGVVVCTDLQPSQVPAIAKRRLEEVCRILAALFAVVREPAMTT